ncbi:hypothetical protein GCM10020000_37210 [Streptomyces olivoverticillatus]
MWLRRYLDAYLTPLLHSFYAYDLAFMPHGENVIMVLDGGTVERVIFKDIAEEIVVMDPEADLPPEVQRIRADIPEEEKLLCVFTDVFDCFFRFLGATLATDGALGEEAFWRTVAECVRDYRDSVPHLAERFERHDIFTEEFALSCLNRLQLRNNQQMVDLADPSAALQFVGTLRNPIARFAPRTVTAVSETAAGAGAPPRLPRLPTRWLILAVICLAQLAVLLDNTILNVAIPSLTRDLGATNADIQWVINAYSLVQAGLLLASGSAADRYGRRKLLLAGLALFGLGSLAAALSQSTAQLTAARGGMGVGGALLLTTTLAVVMQVFDAEERPRAIGIWSAVSALGFAAGPPIGGIMLAHFWWGSIFLLNIPVVVIGLIAVRILVPESKNPGGGPPDLLGALLSAAGMTALVYAIIQMPESGWSSTEVLLPAAAGAAILAAFALWEQHTRHPMLDLHFFRDRRFVGAVSGVVLITFGSAGVLFLLTQQLQFVRGYTPLETGLRMAPFALTIVALNFSGVAFRMGARLGRPASIAARHDPAGRRLHGRGLPHGRWLRPPCCWASSSWAPAAHWPTRPSSRRS